MKRFIMFALAGSFLLYVNNVASYAQGKGSGRGPEISASHAPDTTHTEHGKSADHEKTATNKDSNKSGTWEDRIEQNDKLKAKLITLLGNPDLKTAADGFKNQGQFIAALHVSKNLNIPFADLKAKMIGTDSKTTGTTGTNPESLGNAIHDLKPTLPEADVKKEANKAVEEAKEDEKIEKTKSALAKK
jgi:hypothetical protein